MTDISPLDSEDALGRIEYERVEQLRLKKKAEDEERERRESIQSVKDETLKILGERESLNNK